MYKGDRARKDNLINYGFRLPSAYDNRPLQFEEFYNHMNQVVYVSATPSPWEVEEAGGDVVQQIIRPTGLLDPIIEIRPATNQVDDCLDEIRIETGKAWREIGGGRKRKTQNKAQIGNDGAIFPRHEMAFLNSLHSA